MTPVRLQEWQTLFLPGLRLSEADRRLAGELSAGGDGRLVVEELRDGVRFRAGSWVGVVRFEAVEVAVVPKLAGGHVGLVAMIGFAAGLEVLKRNSGLRTLEGQGFGLPDLLALLLAEACEPLVRRGLLTDYVEREGELPVVRGRLLADRQVRERFGRVDRLLCRFDERDGDIPENRLPAAALAACSRRVAHDDVRRRVRRLEAAFAEVCTVPASRAELGEASIIYGRLNAHYREAHALTCLLLDGFGVRDLLAGGSVGCFAFLLDMNRLFEQFVGRLVERLPDRRRFRVRSQQSDGSIVVDADTGRPYQRVVPDLLTETRDDPVRVLALDARYKLYDRRKLSPADVYQAFLYGQAYGGPAGTALLVHPTDGGPTVARLAVRDRRGVRVGGVTAAGVPIPQALAEAEAGTVGPVAALLLGEIERALAAGPGVPER